MPMAEKKGTRVGKLKNYNSRVRHLQQEIWKLKKRTNSCLTVKRIEKLGSPNLARSIKEFGGIDSVLTTGFGLLLPKIDEILIKNEREATKTLTSKDIGKKLVDLGIIDIEDIGKIKRRLERTNLEEIKKNALIKRGFGKYSEFENLVQKFERIEKKNKRLIGHYSDLENDKPLINAIKFYGGVKKVYKKIDWRNKCIKMLGRNGELLVACKRGDKTALEKLIKENTPLVVGIAARIGPAYDIQDKISAGIYGLIYASRKFDLLSGYRFATYATYWIKQCISLEYKKNAGDIRVPYHIFNKVGGYYTLKEACKMENGREPSESEVMEKLKISKRQLEKASKIIKTLSIDSPVSASHKDEADGTNDDMLLRDFIFDKEDPESVIDKTLIRTRVDNLLNSGVLSEREKRVLSLRSGIDSSTNTPHTLGEVGEMFGISRERVRQIESRALKKLRAILKIVQEKLYPTNSYATKNI